MPKHGKDGNIGMKTLRSAKPGDTVKVVKINGEGALKRRIMDMGVTKGVEIYVRKVAPLGDPITPQNETEKTEESRAGPPLSLYIDSRIFLAAACSMSCSASALLPRSADTMI